MTQNTTDTNEQQGEALLPCPFCGGFADLRFVGDSGRGDEGDWWIGCSRNHSRAATREEAIRKWNTRSYAVSAAPAVAAPQGDELHSAIVEAAIIDHVADENWPVASTRLSNAVERLLEYRAEAGLNTLCQYCRQSVYRSVIDGCWFHAATHNSICEIVSSTVLKATPLRPTKPAPLPPTVYMGFADDADMLADAAASSSLPAHYFVPTETPDKCGVEGCGLNVLAHPEALKHNLPGEPLWTPGNRAKAIRLLRELRETTDPVEVQRQKDSWAQLEQDLNAPAEPVQPEGEQEPRLLTAEELIDIERFQRQRRKNPVPADAWLYVAEIDRLLGHIRFEREQLENEIFQDATDPNFAAATPSTTAAPWRDEGGHAWEIRPNVTCVECPHCCFTFAAVHTDGYSDGYSCPNCEGCPEAKRDPVTTTAAAYSELIHIAAALARADGFISPCAEDHSARVPRSIINSAQYQNNAMKEWANRIRQVADGLPKHFAAVPVGQEGNSMNTVTFGDSKNIANPDVACPKCGGTKPTCCSCPEPDFSLTELVRGFTQAAINAHVGFKHETCWHDCNYASCAKWREMIGTLNAAATPSPASETPVGNPERVKTIMRTTIIECDLKTIESELNSLLLDVYDLSTANAPLAPSYCRETADLVGKHVGEIRNAIARIRTVVKHAGAKPETPVGGEADVYVDYERDPNTGEVSTVTKSHVAAPPLYDGSMTSEQLERAALIAESRGIDLEMAQELVYLRDRIAATSELFAAYNQAIEDAKKTRRRQFAERT